MSLYAIIQAGGRQYRVREQDVIPVQKLNVEAGQAISLDKVLMVKSDEKVEVGTPYISGAAVLCECLGDQRMQKVINYRFRKRKNSRRKRGHRQTMTFLRVKTIETQAATVSV